MKKTFVFDACSIIALLKKEEGATKVQEILEQGLEENDGVLLHKVTLAEVTYDLLRSGDYTTADEIFKTCYHLPVKIVEDLQDTLIAEVAFFKTRFKVSFADSFVLALAKINNASVVTADHHEFDSIEKTGEIKFEWIR